MGVTDIERVQEGWSYKIYGKIWTAENITVVGYTWFDEGYDSRFIGNFIISDHTGSINVTEGYLAKVFEGPHASIRLQRWSGTEYWVNDSIAVIGKAYRAPDGQIKLSAVAIARDVNEFRYATDIIWWIFLIGQLVLVILLVGIGLVMLKKMIKLHNKTLELKPSIKRLLTPEPILLEEQIKWLPNKILSNNPVVLYVNLLLTVALSAMAVVFTLLWSWIWLGLFVFILMFPCIFAVTAFIGMGMFPNRIGFSSYGIHLRYATRKKIAGQLYFIAWNDIKEILRLPARETGIRTHGGQLFTVGGLRRENINEIRDRFEKITFGQ